MDTSADFEDRLAARLLDVPLDADPAAVRGRFRALAKAVHPDRNVLDGCIDLGRLAEAKDRLVRRAENRIARAEAARAAREDEAGQHLDAMRLRTRATPETDEAGSEDPIHLAAFVTTPWSPKPSAMTDRFVSRTPVGLLVDLAG